MDLSYDCIIAPKIRKTKLCSIQYLFSCVIVSYYSKKVMLFVILLYPFYFVLFIKHKTIYVLVFPF